MILKRSCSTCRYAVPGIVRVPDGDLIREVPQDFCHAKGSVQALSRVESTFPIVSEHTFCYGWFPSVRKLIRKWRGA